MKYAQIREVADRLREEYGSERPPVDVLRMTKGLGIDVVVAPLEEAVSGLLVIRKDHATIGVNELHHRHRRRFSIAHELGHYLLHRYSANVFVDSTLTFYRDQKSADGTHRQEIEANS